MMQPKYVASNKALGNNNILDLAGAKSWQSFAVTSRSTTALTPFAHGAEGRPPQQQEGAKYPPDDMLSNAARVILGLEGDGSLGTRLDALELLSQNVNAVDRYALYVFLLRSDRVQNLTKVQEHVLVNDIMEKLRQQADGAPELGPVLAAVFYNSAQDMVVRDYAIQHLGNWFERWPSNQQMEAVLWKALGETQGTIAGAALLSLHRVSQTHAELDAHRLLGEATRVALDETTGIPSRITALGIASAYGANEVLPVARRLVVESKSIALQIAAIGAIGELGTKADLGILRQVAQDQSSPCRAAAESAARKISRS